MVIFVNQTKERQPFRAQNMLLIVLVLSCMFISAGTYRGSFNLVPKMKERTAPAEHIVPDFTETNIWDDSLFSLSDYTDAGQIVIIQLFDTFCGPCLSQMSELRQIYDTFENVTIMSISIDSNDGNINSTTGNTYLYDTAVKYDMDWLVALDTDMYIRIGDAIDYPDIDGGPSKEIFGEYGDVPGPYIVYRFVPWVFIIDPNRKTLWWQMGANKGYVEWVSIITGDGDPPALSNIQISPEIITKSATSINVKLNVTDETGVDSVLLMASGNSTYPYHDYRYEDVSMAQGTDGLWQGTLTNVSAYIGPLEFMHLKVYTNDTEGNKRIYVIRTDYFEDSEPPVLSNIQIIPENITKSTTTINVTLNATDGSSIKSLVLQACTESFCFLDIPLARGEDDLWYGTLNVGPFIGSVDTLFLEVRAEDTRGNSEIYIIGSYNVTGSAPSSSSSSTGGWVPTIDIPSFTFVISFISLGVLLLIQKRRKISS